MTSLSVLRAARTYIEGTAERQLAETLARVEAAEPEGYLPGSDASVGCGFDLDALSALRRLGLIVREIESPPDAPEIAGVKATRYRYFVTERGRAKLDGTLAEHEPILDADVVTDRMATKRRQLAGRAT